MALCSACARISITNLICELDNVPDWWEQRDSQSKARGMLHLSDARQLPLSAAGGCSLCAMIIDASLRYDNNPISTPTSVPPAHSEDKRNIYCIEDHLSNRPIYLRPNYDPRKPAFPEEDVANAWHIRGFKAFVPVDHGVLTGQIRLVAPKDGSAAVSCDVIGRPQLPSSDSPEAYDLINRWMSACLAKHEMCKETFSASIIDESRPPILPSRVIHLGPPNQELSPRLVETKGERAYYVALSHCWGSPLHKLPLMTTQSTLKDYISGIPWDTIPRAYQDAMVATRNLGFEYIWIDSLCILQDSHEDWLHESQHMGTVYENARLTIAASHAADSSQPCFFPRSPQAPSIELPHISPTGERLGSIFASLMPTDYISISPESGPLASRAWATQEWLLSRRMIFYTAGCLVWSCKAISQRETGASFHSTARNHRWKVIVEKYSARGLTKATDRLIALQGLQTEMGKKRENDTYCLGLWKNSMPDQLLWYCLEPAERTKSPLNLPTWTWAGTMHGVRFLDIKHAKNVCEGFRFDEANQTLLIRSRLMSLARVGLLTRHSYAPDTNKDASPAFDDLPHDKVPSELIYAIHCNESGALGWALLDEGRTIHSDIHCLPLMSKKLRFSRSGGVQLKCYKDMVILLQDPDGSSHAFKRVGVGMMTSTTPRPEDQVATWVCVT